MEQIAPLSLAEAWDNSGWQVGDPENTVRKILLSLDITKEVVAEAERQNVQLIISHHPLMLKGIKSIRRDQPTGNLIFQLIKAGIGVYTSHTPLDIALGGVSDVLADRLDLQAREVLQPLEHQKLIKLVVFVPLSHAEAVRTALGLAGAGHIGNYSHCTYNLQGMGTFLPLADANPFIGAQGHLEKVEEVRIETIIAENMVARTLENMLAAHPYEEPAYDLYPLLNTDSRQGLGRIGRLSATLSLSELAKMVQCALPSNCLRYGGDTQRMIQLVAVCGGSGGDLWPIARQKGAEVLITGDIKYHTAQDMLAAGMCFIDAGHFATEHLILPVLRDRLNSILEKAQFSVDIELAHCETEPWISSQC